MAAANPDRRVNFRVGVDENGLGPRLGPMIITAVLARVTEDGSKIAGRKPRGALAQRLGDSKGLISHGDTSLGEAWARALVARGCGRDGAGATAASPDALLHAVAADDRSALRELCPSHVEAQCWSASDEVFAAEDDLVRTVSADLDKLAAKGVDVVAVRSVIVCTQRLNLALAKGLNRFLVDLHAMERLVLDLRAIAGEEVSAVCGKVGGFGKYGDAFGPLAGRLHLAIEEGQARSTYHFPGVGALAFVRDADATDLCVGMASMVGKYVRDALMARVVRFYRDERDDLPDASGYHDPVTTRFVEATRLIRKTRSVPDACFERGRMEGRSADTSQEQEEESGAPRHDPQALGAP
jgi:ribonuclease HII